MVILGLLLLAGATVLAVAVISSNTGAVETDLWGLTVTNVSLGAVFGVGMIAALVGLVGVMMLLGGVRRGSRRRRDRRALARSHRRLTEQAEATQQAPRAPTPGSDTGVVPGESVTPAAGARTGLSWRRPRARHRLPADREPTGNGPSS